MKSHPIYTALGQAIRTRRIAIGAIQSEIAKKSHMSRATLANIETGRQAVLVHQLYEIATALEMKVEALLPSTKASSALLPADSQLDVTTSTQRDLTDKQLFQVYTLFNKSQKNSDINLKEGRDVKSKESKGQRNKSTK